jgi:hypothetical protein
MVTAAKIVALNLIDKRVTEVEKEIELKIRSSRVGATYDVACQSSYKIPKRTFNDVRGTDLGWR